MSAPSLEEIAGALLAAAKRNGADAADVVVAESDSLDVGVRLGEIEKLKQARQKHLGLRAFVGNRSAVTSSADFSRAALDQLAETTCTLARVIAPDPFAGLPEAAELATQTPDLDLYDPEVRAFTAEQAIVLAQTAERAALEADARITNSEGAECSASTGRVVYASSLGFCGTYRDSGVSLSVVPVASENGAMQRDYWYSAQRRLARLEDPAAIGRTAAARAVRRLNARQVSTCEVPVIFDPDMAAGLLRHLAAAVSGNALYKRTSFLLGKLGQRIAPEFVTVVDDGTLVGRLGSKPFDGEGLLTRRTVVVDRGILTSYLFDTYSARKLKSRSTGNAARSVGSPPSGVTVIRPSTRWMTSWVSSSQRDGPGVHTQTPAEASPSSQIVTPWVCIGSPVASSSSPQSSSSPWFDASGRWGVLIVVVTTGSSRGTAGRWDRA